MYQILILFLLSPLFLAAFGALFAFQKYNDMFWVTNKAYFCPRLRAERMNALVVQCLSEHWARKQSLIKVENEKIL